MSPVPMRYLGQPLRRGRLEAGVLEPARHRHRALPLKHGTSKCNHIELGRLGRPASIRIA